MKTNEEIRQLKEAIKTQEKIVRDCTRELGSNRRMLRMLKVDLESAEKRVKDEKLAEVYYE